MEQKKLIFGQSKTNCGVKQGDILGQDVGYCSRNYEARGASGKKYEALIVIFCILVAVNRFSRISQKVRKPLKKVRKPLKKVRKPLKKVESS